MDQLSIMDKNKGMCCAETQNKYCCKHLAVFSIRKPNFANVTHRQSLGGWGVGVGGLLNFAAGPAIPLVCHDWTTQFPSMDHMRNVGKCTFTRAVTYYIL